MPRGKVVSDPEIMFGKPVIEGTRLTVEHILEEMSHGLDLQELLEAYPTLTREGILAALEYAAQVLKSDVLVPTEQAK
ncbi:MAG: hypothetical protein A2064_00410 [Spirochaetes bacterium GWB1_66_5]|jgi:uncharacterized protein (DUF433 family)|nr:MAG: hypothetical protein A2064_00410 [Spirochaetes bacterium GWB1_66_5]